MKFFLYIVKIKFTSITKIINEYWFEHREIGLIEITVETMHFRISCFALIKFALKQNEVL